jgi:hypothetical protein
MLANKRGDGTLQLPDATKGPTSDAFGGDFREESLDRVEPRRTRWREVDMEAGTFSKPGLHERMLMRRIVIHDDVHVELRRYAVLDAVQELQELRVPMTRQAAFDHASGQRVERREQRRYSITDVVVSLRGRQSGTQGKNGSSSLQGLNTAFLIDAQHNRVCRRVHVQSDDISELLRKVRVATKLERAEPMWLQLMSKENPLHCAAANTKFLRKCPRTPVRRVLGRRSHDRLRQFLDGLWRDEFRPARARGIGQDTFHASFEEACANLHDAVPGNAHSFGDLRVRQSLCRVENDLRAQHRSLRGSWASRQLNQKPTILRANSKAYRGTVRHVV